jgi:hypothetical protein
MVTVEALTLMIEYAVAVTVAGGRATDTTTVFVESDVLVIGGSVSVSMIVFVAGAGISVMVSSIVTAGRPPFPVGAEPPSTGTTEYVALLTSELRDVLC